MSAPAADSPDVRWRRLPSWLRPRSEEDPGSGRLRAVETTLLVLVGLVLAVATVNDLVRSTKVNERLIADLRTWRSYTGHDYKNVAVDQQLLGVSSEREVVCGNNTSGPPKEVVQVCLVVAGPTHDGRRAVTAGWYLPAHTEDDVLEKRYGCFGRESKGLCPP
jgi:hypothetical protein